MTTMKDSGIEWIGVISTDFNAVRIKYVFSIIGGCGFKEELQGFSNGKYPFYKASDLANSTTYISAANNYVDEGTVIQEQYKIIPRYSILLPKIGEAMKKNRRCINVTPCIVDNNCQGLVLNTNDNLQYLYYTLSCVDMIWFDNGGTVPCVNNLKLLNAYIPLPPLPEQQRIADYLDKQCSIMDKLAENLQQQIEKLKEYKQSVITEAVTKGLDPNVAMKDSGVEWIGQIPQEWKVVLLSSIFNEHKQKNTDLLCSNLLSLSYGKIIKKNISTADGLLPVSFEGYNIVNKNDIVLRLTDLQNDQRSLRTGLVTEKIGIITSAYVTLRLYASNIASAKYMHYFLYAFDISKGFYGMGDGVRQSLNYDGCKKIQLLFPPLPEQQRIANYLDKKCEEIDKLIKIKQEKIDKLSEYKKSLIYECVTGKREVAHE